MKKVVGKFTLDGGTVVGPKEYMEEQGFAKLEEILDGKSAVFNYGYRHSPDIETAILVALQTDYAGWRGLRGFCKTNRIE